MYFRRSESVRRYNKRLQITVSDQERYLFYTVRLVKSGAKATIIDFVFRCKSISQEAALGDVQYSGLGGLEQREVTPSVDPAAQQLRELQALMARYVSQAEAAAASLSESLALGRSAAEDEGAVLDSKWTEIIEAYEVGTDCHA